MQSFIENIRKNPWLSLIFAVLSGLVILYLSSYLGSLISSWVKQFAALNFYSNNVFMKFFMLLLSLLFILIVNKGSLKGYGFNKPQELKYFRFFLISTGIIIGAFIFANLFFNVILRTLFPPETGKPGFPESQSILEMILTIWIWSSICEEVLTRGFIQGFMNKHINIRLLKLSLPVWVSGLFFGLMHLSLLTLNKDILFVLFIVTNTTILGLLAAYYREKTKSIYPAIFLHFWANVIFSLPMFLFKKYLYFR
ncbi:MAG: CPBP family intramembrane glutamic endopeptidase [Bacteroidota bacterium]|nr:CPBP family intramembrane glutamic endopeptidase [Bacteroidota bacterium]